MITHAIFYILYFTYLLKRWKKINDYEEDEIKRGLILLQQSTKEQEKEFEILSDRQELRCQYYLKESEKFLNMSRNFQNTGKWNYEFLHE